jgi:DNA phosphorothioation-dependent restriction protein DptG
MWFSSIFDYLNNCSKALDNARISYRTYCELSQLSDSDLEKLGLTRSDIPRVSFNIEKT